MLIGRHTISDIRAIVSTPHLKMKYPTKNGEIGVLAVDQKVAKECLVENEKRYGKMGKQVLKEGHIVFEMSSHVHHAPQGVALIEESVEEHDYVLDPRVSSIQDRAQPVG